MADPTGRVYTGGSTGGGAESGPQPAAGQQWLKNGVFQAAALMLLLAEEFVLVMLKTKVSRPVHQC
jgi:hypothetical protein